MTLQLAEVSMPCRLLANCGIPGTSYGAAIAVLPPAGAVDGAESTRPDDVVVAE